jgi:hypothetical protein
MNTITEKQINLIGRRLNNEKPLGELSDLHNKAINEGLRLSAEQERKGLDWLLDQWKTPKGKERKNNPFGYREEDVLENFACIRYDGHTDAGNAWHSWYAPIYTVIDKNDSAFQYYIQGGLIQIIG